MSVLCPGRGDALVLLIFLATLAVPCLGPHSGDWDGVYIPAADRLRSGGDVFGDGYVYPPAAALAAVPAAVLPYSAERAVWWVMNAIAGTVLFAAAWRLAGGPAGDPRTWARPDLAAYGLGLTVAAGFLSDGVKCRQTDLILAALVCGGCRLVAVGRPVAGGTAIGLAAAVKCTPLLLAAYFLWTGRRRAAAAVVVAAVGANLLPDAVYPTADGHARLGEWGARYLGSVASPRVDPGVWYSGIRFNHSLAGLANRLFANELVNLNGIPVAVPRADRVGPGALKLGVLAVGGAGLLLAAAAARRPCTAPAAALGADAGMAFSLMLLLSPMSSKPHFCTLLLPAWVVARAAARGGVALRVIAVAAAGCGLAANKDFVGARIYDTVLWYGSIPAATVLLFGGCWLVRRQMGAAVVAPAPDHGSPEPVPPDRICGVGMPCPVGR